MPCAARRARGGACLGQLLQLRLDVNLPDGRSALLRFWDPRVLVNLARTLDGAQREERTSACEPEPEAGAERQRLSADYASA